VPAVIGDFLSRVRGGPTICGDGAWGSLLMERGLPSGQPPEIWTLERPDLVRAIADEYVASGAEVVTTNTFGGSPLRLDAHRLAGHVETVNASAVKLAREAAADRAWVAASVGPSGRLLAPFGDVDPDVAYASFEQQVGVLTDAGADIICVETMTDLAEATLAVRAASTVVPRLPVIAMMTFDVTARGVFTVMGVRVEQAAQALADAGADVVGANCGHGVEAMGIVAREFATHARTPIAIRPNAGMPQRRDGRLAYSEGPEMFAAAARNLMLPGVALVGGCCGTTPAHIRLLAGQLSASK
jgi:5-methyltetrahydrofolate--homocysteine methyltransferase